MTQRRHQPDPWEVPPPPLELGVARHGTDAIVQLSGELDMATVDALRSTGLDLVDEGSRRLVIDCAGLTFIDSMGLSGLIELVLALDEVEGELLVRSPSRILVSLIHATGLRDVLRIEAGTEPPAAAGGRAGAGATAPAETTGTDVPPAGGRPRVTRLRPSWFG